MRHFFSLEDCARSRLTIARLSDTLEGHERDGGRTRKANGRAEGGRIREIKSHILGDMEPCRTLFSVRLLFFSL